MEVHIGGLTTYTNSGRHIAVDVHPHNFGFVVLENLRVLDCGTRRCDRTQSSDCLGQRFQRILRAYTPSVVVMRLYRRSRPARGTGRPALIDTIRAVAVESRVEVVGLQSHEIQNFFLSRNARTKHERAQAVALLLPELAWKLPPQRKLWQSEHYRMSIFDAAAVALTFIVVRSDPGASSSLFDTMDRSA